MYGAGEGRNAAAIGLYGSRPDPQHLRRDPVAAIPLARTGPAASVPAEPA